MSRNTWQEIDMRQSIFKQNIQKALPFWKEKLAGLKSVLGANFCPNSEICRQSAFALCVIFAQHISDRLLVSESIANFRYGIFLSVADFLEHSIFENWSPLMCQYLVLQNIDSALKVTRLDTFGELFLQPSASCSVVQFDILDSHSKGMFRL